MYIGQNPSPEVTCKFIIRWSAKNIISFVVDKRANCPGSAGVGFLDKSARFYPQDYKRAVTFELADSETFLSARAADGC